MRRKIRTWSWIIFQAKRTKGAQKSCKAVEQKLGTWTENNPATHLRVSNSTSPPLGFPLCSLHTCLHYAFSAVFRTFVRQFLTKFRAGGFQRHHGSSIVDHLSLPPLPHSSQERGRPSILDVTVHRGNTNTHTLKSTAVLQHSDTSRVHA